ncbi:MAG: phenylalanine--tRNA ligase subunit beta [Candidatus Ratteibacteria bacterium]|nr:phenylalanine--tRNA ligase subunit beta [Candidatus Ratteibacteria bacterium]
MRYSYRLITEYIDGAISSNELLNYLEILGLNPSVVDKNNDDIIFELEIPANRGYLLSLLGIVREVVPFINASVKIPPLTFEETSTKIVPVKIEDKNDCAYYSCRVVENVSVEKTETFLKNRIEKLGYRSSLNVVDISNYVMAEIGQPLHIFDLDKVEQYVEVRRARKGETLVTIDGKKRDLDESVMVIADSKKIIAIAGIMGGQNSEVTADTKNVLIESAIFNPVVVRRGSKKIGLTTEASARFERGISIDTCKTGMARTALLTSNICKGNAGPLSESGVKEEPLPVIKFNMAKVNNLSGTEIKEEFVIDLLTRLNFQIKKENGTFVVSPPSYRNDIKEDVDIVEEIIRYRQYETIPVYLPVTSIKPTTSSPEVEIMERIKDICIQLGFTEVVHMGLTSKENTDFSKDTSSIEIENPISANLQFLRTSLIPEMLETIKFNIYHGTRNFNIFEIGNVYYREDDTFKEEAMLSFISINTGNFFNLKGKVESLFDRLHLKNIEFKKENGIFGKKNNLAIYLNGLLIGNIFILSDEIKEHFDLKKCEIYGSELKLKEIVEKSSFLPVFREPPRYPPSRRDFSFIFHEDIEWQEIENTILSLELPVEKIEFFDVYRTDDMPENTVSISFSVFFRSTTETLSKEDVIGFSEKVIKTIYQKLKGQLRGSGGET